MTILNFWDIGVEKERTLFYAAIIGAALLTIPSLIVILQHEL